MPAVLRSLLISAAVAALSTTASAETPYAGSGPISPEALSQTIKVLASDEFAGRAPGTVGEQKTIPYLIERFRALGLQPAGDGGGWTQDVPLLRTQVAGQPVVSVTGPDGAKPLVQNQDIYVATVRPVDEVAIARAPMVFVGYGVSAPERGWDDFKGVDLHGKVAVFLVNDPDFEAEPGEPAAGKFGGQAMTYYGRWTYKYEEAARRGAIAALIVHETPGAGYGWSTVIAPKAENYDLVRPNGAADRVPLQGWLTREAAATLLHRAGLDLDALKRQARSADFHPVELKGLSFSAEVKVDHAVVQSHNVLARVPGTTRAGEAVMYAAHWDAYGVAPQPDASGQRIRRGALDDGMGVAGLFEIARAFKAGPAPRRTVLFGVWTAEERNLLGSEYFAGHPTFPLDKVAAAFTIDVLQSAGPAHDVVLVGAGQNQLDDLLDRTAATQGRTLTPDAHPEKGLFYRADHFSLAKRGVPVQLLMGIGGGADLVNGGRAAGQAWIDDYTAHCYHQTCDAWHPDWDLRGAAQDVDLLYLEGRELANSGAWPDWNASSEFKPARDATAASRR